jgi:hypothetical protein
LAFFIKDYAIYIPHGLLNVHQVEVIENVDISTMDIVFPPAFVIYPVVPSIERYTGLLNQVNVPEIVGVAVVGSIFRI